MGRELRRVPLDFDWPVGKTWKGFLNDKPNPAIKCPRCGGHGGSQAAERLKRLWYGYDAFKPEDRGSVPFTPDDEAVRRFAKRNVEHSPGFYGSGEAAIEREAIRLCQHWNGSWSHHLNADDVAALIEAGRLHDLTSEWVDGKWRRKDPMPTITPRDVNEWSIGGGMGHDSINQWICVRAECARLGEPDTCDRCDGEGELWPSPEAKAEYESWEPTNPPSGAGYQIWETVSEGSPISPVFATARELADHMATTRWGADKGTSAETWLAFIEGPGWAPSMIGAAGAVVSGVEGVVALAGSNHAYPVDTQRH